MTNIEKTSGGYIALISVMIIGAVLLLIIITGAHVGTTQGINSLLFSNHTESESLISACGEQALMNLKDNPSYGGNETVSLGNGECQILAVTSQGGEVRSIQVTSAVGGARKKNLITVSQINPKLLVSSWQEVAEF
ncbi:MAG: Uncharacterized protein Athens101428_212 [Candidatus Berkelbacteria bacterium Athens1014_28]|uniref:Uncharacterized protein n=1 Tax=Candidatus Berkelbacteria bacterium Athens1014_28 TaxID=2017145 RepID=A0A554LPA3_9BACT|nr:MAG: Uncharacterized protein Athens101428_212 [Candidatus Berkelbacteria bacterium Athens1014_28]